MRHVTTFLTLMGAAALVACASRAPAPASFAATGTSRAAVPAATALAGQKGQKGQKPADFPGYRRVVANGQERFCRNEVITGSLIKQQTCLTRAQVEALRTDSQQFLQQNLKNSSTCAAKFGLGGNPCQE